MAQQVSDIMDYSELEIGNLAVNPESYMLSSLFNDLISELRPRVSPDVELVIDVGLSQKDLGLVRDELERKGQFENITFQKASPAVAARCGSGVIGLAYRDAK